jgi:hypothetical protein
LLASDGGAAIRILFRIIPIISKAAATAVVYLVAVFFVVQHFVV